MTILLTALAFLLTNPLYGDNPPPLDQCKHALSTCDTYATALEGQVKQLQEEVVAYKKEVGKGQEASIMLYTALGGALAGGTIGLVREGGQQGLLQAITGAGVGALLGAVLEEFVK